jgi:hypothetical protein
MDLVGIVFLTAFQHKPAYDSSELPLKFIVYLSSCSIKVQALAFDIAPSGSGQFPKGSHIHSKHCEVFRVD